MAVEKITIEIAADTSGIDDLIKTLQKLGLVTEKDAEAVEKLGKESQQASKKSKKGFEEAAKGAKKLSGEMGTLDKISRNVTQAIRGFIVFNILKKVGSLFGDAVSKVAEFEEAVDNLSAITGATGSNLAFLRNEAIRLGSSTTKSATEVVDAFKKVASLKPELLSNADALAQVTANVIMLSEASGGDLSVDAAAEALTGTLNQFNLTAEDSVRVMNALAAGSKFGSADIVNVSAALSKFGVVADSFNISVEESVALVEVLGEKNIQGAEAGTKLRNVLTILSTADVLPKEAIAQLEKFGVNTDIVTDLTIPLNERLLEFSKISNDAAALTKVFGRENLVAGQVLLQNVSKFDRYTDAVTGTQTALLQAKINTDNIKGSQAALGSAIEGLVLSLEDGNGQFGSFVKHLLDFGAATVKAITPTKNINKELRKEQNELNFLIAEITDTNIAEEERAEKIEELNEIYPGFLANLDAETASNEELRDRLIEVNEQLEIQAKQRLINAKIEAKSNEIAETEFSLLERSTALRQKLSNQARNLGLDLNEFNVSTEEGLASLAQTIDETLFKSNALGTGAASAIDKINEAAEGNLLGDLLELGGIRIEAVTASATGGDDRLLASNALEQVLKLQDESERARQELIQLQETAKEFLGTPDSLSDLTGGRTDEVEEEVQAKTTRAAKKGGDDRLKLRQKFADDLARLTRDQATAAIEDARELAIQLENDRAEDELAQLDARLKKLAEKEIQLTTEQQAQIAEIRKGIAAAAAREIAEINKEFDAEALEADEQGIEDAKQVFIDGAEDIALEARKANAEEIEDREARKLADLEIERDRLASLLALEEEGTADFNELRLKQIKNEEEIADQTQKTIEESAKKRLESLVSFAEQISDFASGIGDLTSALSNRKIAAIDEETNAALAAIDLQLEAEELSVTRREELLAQRTQIEQDADDQRREIELKRAKREKALNVFEAVVATARAVAQTLPNIPLSIAVGLLGALQVAAIVAEPLPAFAKGTDNAPGGWALVGEEGPELAYIPKGSQIKTAGQTQKMLDTDFSKYGAMPSPGVMDYGAMIDNFEKGREAEKELQNIQFATALSDVQAQIALQKDAVTGPEYAKGVKAQLKNSNIQTAAMIRAMRNQRNRI